MDQAVDVLTIELIESVFRGDLHGARRAIAQGANPDAQGKHRWTPLACAAENDLSGEMVKLLVHAGADVNRVDRFGQTPLHIAIDAAVDKAAQHNEEQIDWTTVSVLMDCGADSSVKDQVGRSLEDFITQYGGGASDSFRAFLKSRHKSVEKS